MDLDHQDMPGSLVNLDIEQRKVKVEPAVSSGDLMIYPPSVLAYQEDNISWLPHHMDDGLAVDSLMALPLIKPEPDLRDSSEITNSSIPVPVPQHYETNTVLETCKEGDRGFIFALPLAPLKAEVPSEFDGVKVEPSFSANSATPYTCFTEDDKEANRDTENTLSPIMPVALFRHGATIEGNMVGGRRRTSDDGASEGVINVREIGGFKDKDGRILGDQAILSTGMVSTGSLKGTIREHIEGKTGSHNEGKTHQSLSVDLEPVKNSGIVRPVSKMCDYASSSRAHRRMRIREKPYKCSQCDFNTAEKRNFDIHIRIHKGEKPYSCSMCEYKTTNQRNLTEHMIIHAGEKSYKCPQCPYASVAIGSLLVHMRIHTDEKPYRCSLCEYKFSHQRYLTIHMKIHAREPYKCSQCPYVSARAYPLRVHMRSHTEEMPYSCALCEFRTGNKRHLNDHMRTHTGEKSYICSRCGSGFSNCSHLEKHIRTHSLQDSEQWFLNTVNQT